MNKKPTPKNKQDFNNPKHIVLQLWDLQCLKNKCRMQHVNGRKCIVAELSPEQ